MLGKNRRKKVRKSVFYIRTNIVPKNGGEKRAKQFFQKQTNSGSKKCWENTSEKSAKSVFYVRTIIVPKNLGEKTRETIFPETDK